METNRGGTEPSHAKSREVFNKRWVKVAGAVVALIVLTLIVVPFFVNADTFRPTVESRISSALGRQVTLGHLSFSLFSGSLVADNIAIADDPAFSATPFAQAKSLHIGVSTGDLLFHRQLRITNFTADSPQIHLISKPNGEWNYSSLGRGGSTSTAQAGTSDLSIGELKIKNGSVDVSSQPATGAPFVYNHVNITVQHLSFTTPMPFHLTADLPANGTVKLTGTAGPIAQPNAMNTPLQASVEVKHFDPVAAGAVAPADGISMLADLDAQLNSNGQTLTMTGKLTAANLKLSPEGTPAPQPVHVDLAATENLATRTGQISDLAIHTGSMAAHVNGTYQLTGQTVSLNLHLSAPGLPVDGLEQLLPAIGIKLPSGSSLHGGTLTANLAITGPAAAPRISGPVEIDNTELAGFALGSKIEGLASQTGSKSGGTSIHTLRAIVTSTPQSTDLSQIYGDVPGIGTATGNGTVSAAGALNFQLLAKLDTTGGIGGAATTAMSSLGTVGGFFQTASTNGIPLTITGTTSNPIIRANIGSMMKQQAGGILGKGTSGTSTKSGASSILNGILHK